MSAALPRWSSMQLRALASLGSGLLALLGFLAHGHSACGPSGL